MRVRITLYMLLIGISLNAQQIKLINTGKTNSYRGLSVVSDQVIWISGTKGSIGKSLDGGNTWSFYTVKDYEEFDFRDIEAFDSLNAVIMSSGAPARFLITTDGGNSWTTSYKNEHKQVFFDGMDFWDNKHGLAFSDPINGKLVIVETMDGGNHWRALPEQMLPSVSDSEAGFAASGSSIRCLKNGMVVIGTGGSQAHLFIGSNYGKSWSRKSTPIAQKNNASGIFSLYFTSANNGIIVGGNYMADSISDNNCYITNNGGTFWKAPNKSPVGYQSCITQVSTSTYISTGTRATCISEDKGKTWRQFSKEGFNAVSKAKRGKAIFLVGSKGKLAIFVSK